jgi:uncharacterized protein YfaS (alpha-2-macroglobulin family)
LWIELAEQGRAQQTYALEALREGDHELLVRVETPAGDAWTKTLKLGVRRLTQPVRTVRTVQLEPDAVARALGDAWAADLRSGDFVPDTVTGWLSISGVGTLDVPGLLWSLDRYPYGCAEQLSSRVLPLLYLNGVSQTVGLADDAALRDRVRDAIARLLSYQSANGGFGLWGPGSSDLWLEAYVSDVLTRAREQGYQVPPTAFSSALDNLRNRIGYASDFDRGGEGIAYALYVLARNSRVPVGDLRYYQETKLEAFATPMARAQLGAALALYGETERAALAFRSALALWQQPTDIGRDGGWRADFGSQLRDGAALLALAAETEGAGVELQALTTEVVRAWKRAERHSTQEQAWMLTAAATLMQGAAKPRLSVDGQPVEGALYRGFSSAQVDGLSTLEIANRGERPLTALVTAVGIPRRPPPATSNGYQIERTYYGLDGQPIEPGRVTQGERLVVLLRITADRARAARVLIEDPFPAGLEIENPHLLRSGSVDGLPWLGTISSAAHVAFGADRFVAAVDRDSRDPRSFQLAYVVRVVSPGTFAHPAAMVEAMYQPQRYGRTDAGQLEVRSPE